MDKNERNEKIELYGRGYELLKAALSEVPQAALKFKPAPMEWSVHEIIIHLADSETNAAMRARKLIVEPGGALMGYDQDKWASKLNYHDQNIEDALEITRLARKTTYALLKKQPDEVFSHAVTHPEYQEPFAFERWLVAYSNHIPAHIAQIKENVKKYTG
jgi:hypothetical protein